MNIRMKRGMALVLMASLLLAGSAQALFGLGKSKPETVSPENGPTARDLEIRTYRSIPYQGQLEGTDPDGGELTFAIVTQPKKGTVTVEGANFTYTPKENAAGGDSFTYSAANSAGAVSQSATVTVTIEKTRSGVTYADTDEATATAAQDLAEQMKAQKHPIVSGIMIRLFSSQLSPSFPAYSTLFFSLGICLFTGFYFFFVTGHQ